MEKESSNQDKVNEMAKASQIAAAILPSLMKQEDQNIPKEKKPLTKAQFAKRKKANREARRMRKLNRRR